MHCGQPGRVIRAERVDQTSRQRGPQSGVGELSASRDVLGLCFGQKQRGLVVPTDERALSSQHDARGLVDDVIGALAAIDNTPGDLQRAAVTRLDCIYGGGRIPLAQCGTCRHAGGARKEVDRFARGDGGCLRNAKDQVVAAVGVFRKELVVGVDLECGATQ